MNLDVRVAAATEPRWLQVIGGPLPVAAALRESMPALLVPLALLFWGLFLSLPLQIVAAFLALLLTGLSGRFARRRYFYRQRLRVLGNVLEHRDGAKVQRLALTRAVTSFSAGGPEELVLVLDDGTTQIAVGCRVEAHEVAGLPPRLGLWLELAPADFAQIRAAAERPYARA